MRNNFLKQIIWVTKEKTDEKFLPYYEWNSIKTKELLGYAGEPALVVTDVKEVYELCSEKDIPVAFAENEWNRDRNPEKCRFVLQNPSEIEEEEFEKIYRRLKGLPWDIMETKHTYLREFTMSDMDDLFDLYSQPGMTDYVENLFEREKEEEYQKKYIDYVYGFYGYGMWLVFDRENGRLIGRAGLESKESCEGNQLEIGYMLRPNYQHKGLAREICAKIVDYAFEELEADSLVAYVSPENIRSIRLIEGLGFLATDQYDKGDRRYELKRQ